MVLAVVVVAVILFGTAECSFAAWNNDNDNMQQLQHPADTSSNTASPAFQGDERASFPKTRPDIQNLVCQPQEPLPDNHGSGSKNFKCEFLVVESSSTERVQTDEEATRRKFCDAENAFCVEARILDFAWDDVARDDFVDSREENDEAQRSDREEETGITSWDQLPLVKELYEPPFSQYGEKVESVLRDWLAAAAATRQQQPYETDNDVDNDTSYMTAEWLHQLGVVHRYLADLQTHHLAQTKKKDDTAALQQQVDWGVRAFRLALQYYEGLEAVATTTTMTTTQGEGEAKWFDTLKQLHLAIGHFNLGDIIGLSKNPKQAALSKDYLVRCHETFSKFSTVLMQPPPDFSSLQTLFPYSNAFRDNLSLKVFWKEARSAWAQACSRLGALELDSSQHANGSGSSSSSTSTDDHFAHSMADLQTLAADALQDLIAKGNINPEEQVKALEEIVQAHLPKLLASSERAQAYFQQSVHIFKAIVDNDDDDSDDEQMWRFLGAALQNLGTTVISRGDLVTGAQYLEEALEVSDKTVKAYNHKQMEREAYGDEEQVRIELDDLKNALGEILYGLSDTYLQLGQYEKSNNNYDRAMAWYQEHNLPPTQEIPILEGAVSQSIHEYERVLEQYQDMLAAGGDTGPTELDSGAYYRKDDGYEADLHSTLGALYMSSGDLTEAIVHISQAIRLYTLIGEQGERHYADAKNNQALLFFRQGEYAESAEARREALELYQRISGDGVNPYMAGIDMSSIQNLIDEAQRDQFQPQQQTGDNKKQPQQNGSGGGANAATIEAQIPKTFGSESIRMHHIHLMGVPEASSNETDIVDDILPIKHGPQ